MHSLFIFDLDKADERKIAQELLDKFNKLMPEQELPSSNKKEEGIFFKQFELATDKQKWRMKQLSIKFDDSTTKSEAHRLISEKMDSVEG